MKNKQEITIRKNTLSLKTNKLQLCTLVSLLLAGCGNGNLSQDDIDLPDVADPDVTAEASIGLEAQGQNSSSGTDALSTPSGLSIADALQSTPSLGAAVADTATTEEAAVVVAPAPVTAPEPAPAPEPTVQPDVENATEVVAQTEPEPVIEPEPVEVIEPVVEPEPVIEPEPVVEPEPETEAALPVVTLPRDLPPVECLQFPTQTRQFGDIGVDDWRNWVSPHRLRFAVENDSSPMATWLAKIRYGYRWCLLPRDHHA